MKAKFFSLAFFVCVVFSAQAQMHYRVEVDFTIKEKSETKEQLIVGKVFFDKRTKSLLYDISFPDKEIWLIRDTTMYVIRNNKVITKSSAHGLVDFSVYNLLLNGSLSFFGLDKSPYKLTNTEKVNNMLITNWLPPDYAKTKLGMVKLAQTEKKLTGLINYNIKGEIISKQFFNNYIVVSGTDVPTEIIQFNYLPHKQEKKITTFRNYLFNNKQNEALYNYKLPTL